MKSVKTTVTVPFGHEKRPPVVIAPHAGWFTGEQGIPLRVYPPGCTLTASVGTITRSVVRSVDIQGGMISFSGREGRLKYVPASIPTIDFEFGFTEKGEVVTPPVTFTVDQGSALVRSNKSFQGLAKAGLYTALYELIYYRPVLTLTGIGSNAGLHIEYGSIAAYLNGTLTIYDVPAPTWTENNERIEIYRVVSETILAENLEWEKPQTWGNNYTGTYTGGTPGPSDDTFVLKERVHELGYVTVRSGMAHYETFSQTLAHPFSQSTLIKSAGTTQFQPIISLKKKDPKTLFADNATLRGIADAAIKERETIEFIRPF